MSISLRTKYLSIKKEKLSETAKGVLKSMYDATDGFKDVKSTRKIKPKFEAFYDKLVKSKPEAIKGATKPKETSSAKQFKEARERRKSQAGVPKKESDIERDADRPAIDRKGKRVTDGTHYPYKKGNVYYEYRDNRYDKRPAKYPKLEDGGMMADGGVIDNNYKFNILNQHIKNLSLDKNINGFEFDKEEKWNFSWRYKKMPELKIYATPFSNSPDGIDYEEILYNVIQKSKDKKYKLTGDLDEDTKTYFDFVESVTKKALLDTSEEEEEIMDSDGQTDEELYDALKDMGYKFGKYGTAKFNENAFSETATNLGYRWDEKKKVWHNTNMMAHGGETHRSQGGDLFADGGTTDNGNVEMVMSNTKAIQHHAEELKKLVDMNTPIEAWVVAKLERAETDLSDVTHYIDGLKSAEYADGGELDGHDVELFYNAKAKVADPYTIVIDGSVYSMSGTSGPMSVNMYAGEIDEFEPQAVKGWGKKINFVNADPELIKQIESRFEEYADGGMMAKGGELNLGIRKMAEEAGFTPKELGKDYELKMAQAVVESLTDANFHTEARVLVSILEKKPELAVKPDYPSPSDPKFNEKFEAINKKYDSKYWDADDKTRDFAIKVSQKSGWDGNAIAGAYEYLVRVDGGYHKLADNIQKAMEYDTETMAKGGHLAAKTKVEVGDEKISVIKNRKEKTGYPIYVVSEGYAPITLDVCATKELAEKKAKALANREGYKMEDGGYMAYGGKMADGGKMAKGAKLKTKAKYIPKYQIEEVEVDINGKEKEIDGADLLDGLYVKKAAVMTKKAAPKKAKGGEVKAKSNRGGNVKEIVKLAKEIRKDGEKWTDAVKRASAQLKK